MSKKNSIAKRKSQHAYLLREEERQQERAAQREQKREARRDGVRLMKKPKVKPVVANPAKQLKRQLKSLSLSSRKIDMKDSDSSSDEADQPQGVQSQEPRGDMKQRKGVTRSDYV